MKRPHVIIIEQDLPLGELYVKQLAERFDVSHVREAQSAIDLLDRRGAALIITDILLGANNGIEIIHELRSYDDWLSIPLILLSSLPLSSFPQSSAPWDRYDDCLFMYKPKTKPKKLMQVASMLISP